MAEDKKFTIAVVEDGSALSTADKKADIVLMETETEGIYRVVQDKTEKLKVVQPPKPKRKVESVKM